MHLIDTYKHIDRREMLDCRMKSIKELMRNYNINISSFEIMILCEAFSFNYTYIKIPGVLKEYLPYATVSQNDVVETFFNNIGLFYNNAAISNSKSDWKH